jgi:S-adenosylmethionine:tRNA ribosyltransferase-isomerase
MKAATAPRSATSVRILVVDGFSGAMKVVPSAALASLFEPGDVLVVNDAATLPASLAGRTETAEEIELRLVAQVGERCWTAALFGSGDWRTRTEARPPPPRVFAGDRLLLGDGLIAVVRGFRPESSRLVEIDLELADRSEASLAELWSALYRAGRPVQYAHVPGALALWDVQNVYAARPWALEMPSAGRGLRIDTLLELQRRGVEIARVTHAAGLSSIGDRTIDAILPLPERYEVDEETWEAIARARKRGGRVVAIGTSAVRALEGGARDGKRSGVTDLRIGPGVRRAIVDAVLTGVHEIDTSHHELLGAFVSSRLLEQALACAEEGGLLGHEMGDAWLVWGEPRKKLPAHRGQRQDPGSDPTPSLRRSSSDSRETRGLV